MVYALGEMLLDVLADRPVPPEKYITLGHPGGAMLNAAVSLTRSGINTALISETGNDRIAQFLLDFLNKNGVATQWIQQYAGIKASVALATLDHQKKARYTFLKNYPEKRQLKVPTLFSSSDVLLFGSLYALDPTIRPQLKNILQKAKTAGSILLYDPNIRKPEQLSNPLLRKALEENLQIADIIKGSDEDFQAIFGKQSIENHIDRLQQNHPEALVFITLGEKGARAFYQHQSWKKTAWKVPVISTIGAGDGFNAGIVAAMIRHRLSRRQLPENIPLMLDTGISFSAEVCRSKENYIPRKGKPL